MATSAFAVEVITLPVNDVDRALQFYLDRIGFAFDVDWRPREDFGVVQLTPPGSGCSIQIGTGLTEATRARCAIPPLWSTTSPQRGRLCWAAGRPLVRSAIRRLPAHGTAALHGGSIPRAAIMRAPPTSRPRLQHVGPP